MYSMFVTMALSSMSSDVGCHGCVPAPAPVPVTSYAPACCAPVYTAPVCTPVCDPCAVPAKKHGMFGGGLFKKRGHGAAEVYVAPTYYAPTPMMYGSSAPCTMGMTTVPPMMTAPMPSMAPAPMPAMAPAPMPAPTPMPK